MLDACNVLDRSECVGVFSLPSCWSGQFGSIGVRVESTMSCRHHSGEDRAPKDALDLSDMGALETVGFARKTILKAVNLILCFN